MSLFALPKRYPFAFGVCAATIKTGTVDLLIQRYVEQRKEIDWKRTQAFTVFGCVFLGAWQYTLFVRIMPTICPNAEAFAAKPLREKLKDARGLKDLALQNFVENGINNPLLFFPCFYTVQEFLTKGFERGSVRYALSKYRANCYEDVPAIWALWVPAQFINFAFSPMWLRVPFVVAVSCVWTSYVSLTRGSTQDRQTAESGSPAAAASDKDRRDTRLTMGQSR
jgi:protein Mpv17